MIFDIVHDVLIVSLYVTFVVSVNTRSPRSKELSWFELYNFRRAGCTPNFTG